MHTLAGIFKLWLKPFSLNSNSDEEDNRPFIYLFIWLYVTCFISAFTDIAKGSTSDKFLFLLPEGQFNRTIN